MEKRELEVFNLDHLGLVASIIDRIGLVEVIDAELGSKRGEKVSSGIALKAALLNALGFVSAPLYLFEHFFRGKPTEHLLGAGVTPELLNDDRMGRLLDDLHAADLTSLFVKIATRARARFNVPVRSCHLDSSSFHLHGQYPQSEAGRDAEEAAEPQPIRITHGYSKDHRPDLKQFVINLLCANSGGIPLLYAAGDGNQSDHEALAALLTRYRELLDFEALVVIDAASYSEGNLQELEGLTWLTRVPASLKEVQGLLAQEVGDEAWLRLEEGVRGFETQSAYGGIIQRWLLVESEARQVRECSKVERKLARAEEAAQKAVRTLQRKRFACTEDAEAAVAEMVAGLPYHRLGKVGYLEEKRYSRRGRPGKDTPLTVHLRVKLTLEADFEVKQLAERKAGRFVLASNELDPAKLTPQQMLARYKDQTRTVERGFRFLKDPLFFTSSVFLKREQRIAALGMVMALALLVYAVGEWELRRSLSEQQLTLPDQKGKATARPTLRWVFQLFMAVHLVKMAGALQVVNLDEVKLRVVNLLGEESRRYYLRL